MKSCSLIFIIILFLLLMSCGKKVSIHHHYDSVPGEYIVKTTTNNIVVGDGCTVINKISTGYFKVKCDDGKKIKKIKNIEYIEPNYIWRTIRVKDPLFSKLWGLKNVNGIDIDAMKAWDLTRGSKKIKIMVIDTGIDYKHPDLKENIWLNQAELTGKEGIDDDGNGCIDDFYGCDFANKDGDPMDDNGHGTHCAGTIGAKHNNIGVAGVMSDVTLVACKFLTGSGRGTTVAAIKCIDYGIKIGVDIMSNSWGGGGASQALKDAIQRAADAGILFVAAAGNNGSNNDSRPHYPSDYDVANVISVAAHANNGKLASFSCYGKKTVHVAAPGKDILSTIPGNKYKSYSGTSMATPHVSGVLGLLLAYEGFNDFEEVKQRLMSTGEYNRAWKRKLISGARINAYNLLKDIKPPRPTEPKPEDWISMSVNFESEHPYKNNIGFYHNVKVPKAKYIRVIIEKIDLETKYDFLYIRDKNGTIIESISGTKKNYYTEYVEGEKLSIQFKTDRSKTKWGYRIKEIEYQK